MRGISEKFLSDLKGGNLYTFLEAVKQDDTLCLEIRNDYINIYYRGGNMFRIEQKSNYYDITFDFNYCRHDAAISKYESILRANQTLKEWADSIPYIKAEMDLWLYEHPKLEREYQQLILRDNNCSSIAGDTDYFIADIEYANNENGSRFDLLGIKWPSISSARKKADSPSLTVMELKYGDGALSGTAGIVKHFNDMHKFFSNLNKVENLYKETETMFNQKVELGLISGTSKIITLDRTSKPEFLLLFANHKPIKSVLKREIKLAKEQFQSLSDYLDVRIAIASHIGYGLYENTTVGLKEYLDKLDEY